MSCPASCSRCAATRPETPAPTIAILIAALLRQRVREAVPGPVAHPLEQQGEQGVCEAEHAPRLQSRVVGDLATRARQLAHGDRVERDHGRRLGPQHDLLRLLAHEVDGAVLERDLAAEEARHDVETCPDP